MGGEDLLYRSGVGRMVADRPQQLSSAVVGGGLLAARSGRSLVGNVTAFWRRCVRSLERAVSLLVGGRLGLHSVDDHIVHCTRAIDNTEHLGQRHTLPVTQLDTAQFDQLDPTTEIFCMWKQEQGVESLKVFEIGRLAGRIYDFFFGFYYYFSFYFFCLKFRGRYWFV